MGWENISSASERSSLSFQGLPVVYFHSTQLLGLFVYTKYLLGNLLLIFASRSSLIPISTPETAIKKMPQPMIH
jgi:hypothetical protein